MSFILLVLAYAMLLPGITEPVLHIVTTLDKAELATIGKDAILQNANLPEFLMPMATELVNSVQVTGTVVIHDSAKSILSTSQSLWEDGNHTVAILIVTFSIVVPALKLLLIAFAYLWQNSILGWRLKLLSAAMSKWSMADVFAIALLISFLAIKSTEGRSSLVENQINFETGFYYFIGYCLLSILASQLMRTDLKPNPQVAASHS
jgi:uncharacterized paraquat-inducible protein A